jgi:hypothetical protein
MIDARLIRAELASAFERFEETARTEDEVRFEGRLRAGPALLGPPGRVHGGLHPVLRLLAPLERLTGRAGTSRGPIALECALYRALPLEAPVPFEGTLERRGDGFRLFTRFAETERLDGWARSVDPAEAAIDPAPWREALAEDLAAPEEQTFMARGTVPMRIGTRLVSMTMDEAFFAPPDQELRRYRREDGALDAPFITVALDMLGACAAGFAWRTHLFTTRLDLVLVREPPRSAEPLLVLGDRRSIGPRAGSTLPAVEVNGVSRGESEVPVILASAGVWRSSPTGS